ncbi:unnamed protein product, partial [Owenia fusiformis]
ATDLFPLFKLELDPCLPNKSVSGVNGKLWEYIYRGRDTAFILSTFVGQDATIPVCVTWGCIVNQLTLESLYTADRYKYYTMTHAGISDVAEVFDLILKQFGWNKVGLI